MPGTLVCFHAHPDDEAIATGGTMARAAAEGHRVVLVLATAGELGEVPDGLLAPGESLAARRREETARAAEVLGVARVAYLGYRDSGMAGEPSNDDAGSFWRADLDEAAQRLASLLEEERAEVLTIYDERGGYGHPDHIQVHRVGVRAAARARTPRVYEATLDRDHVQQLMARVRALHPELPDLPHPEDFAEAGTPHAEITTHVDVRPFVGVKRAAIAAHASQVGPEHFFLTMPDEVFADGLGWEWFIRRHPEGRSAAETWLFP